MFHLSLIARSRRAITGRMPPLRALKVLVRCLSLSLLLIALAASAAPAAAATQAEGLLVGRHGDPLDGARMSSIEYFVDAPTGRVELDDPQPSSLVGRQVTVRDTDSRRPGVQGTARANTDATAPPAAPAPGAHSLLVLPVTLTDAANQPFSQDQIRAAVFNGPGSASALFAQQSGDSTSFTGVNRADGDISATLALPVGSAGCPYDAIAAAADAAASAAGWDPARYQHILYLLPNVGSCAWAGLGEMPGRRTWTNGYLQTSVVAHELGHNLMAHHASTLRCSEGGQPVTLSVSCSSSEYGDPFDVMGLTARLMSSFHRAQLGELPESAQVSLTRSGSVRLATAGEGSGTRLVLIPRSPPGVPVTSYYALERRAPSAPFDDFALDAPVSGGVSLRIVPRLGDSVQTQLLDANPQTAGFADAALAPGRTFSDPARGITVSVGADPADVQVTISELVDDVAPFGGSGGSSGSSSSAAPEVGTVLQTLSRIRRVRGGWRITMRFTARNATWMRASKNGRQLAVARRSSLTARTFFPAGARRITVRVSASNRGGSSTASWTYRPAERRTTFRRRASTLPSCAGAPGRAVLAGEAVGPFAQPSRPPSDPPSSARVRDAVKSTTSLDGTGGRPAQASRSFAVALGATGCSMALGDSAWSVMGEGVRAR